MSGGGDRFLIVRLGALGDVVHGIPVVAALRQAHPSARIDWLVDPRYLDLLGCVRDLDDRIGVDPRAGLPSLLGVIRTLRRRRYTAALDLQGLVKSAVLARLAGAGRTIGFSRKHLREPLARFFYSSTVDVPRGGHVIERNLALLDALVVPAGTLATPIEVPITSASENVRQTVGDDYVVLNGGAGWPNKQWPPEQFGAVAAQLHERLGLRSIVLWGPGEERIAEAIVGASHDAAILAPPTSIVDVLAIVKRARLVIAGDTGPIHLAGAVGTPIVGLYGPTDPRRNGPWAKDDLVVSRYSECSCHYRRRCHVGVPCIESITVADVVDAAERRVTASR